MRHQSPKQDEEGIYTVEKSSTRGQNLRKVERESTLQGTESTLHRFPRLSGVRMKFTQVSG